MIGTDEDPEELEAAVGPAPTGGPDNVNIVPEVTEVDEELKLPALKVPTVADDDFT